MENQPPQPANPSQTPAAPSAPAPVPQNVEPAQTVFVKKTPMQMIGSLFSGLSPKKSTTPPAASVDSHTVAPPKRNLPIKKILIIVVVLLIFLIILSVVMSIIARMRNGGQVVEATPTPQPTEPAATPPPTRYATDSGVLKIENDVNDMDKNLSEIDIDEVNIKPRTLNWDVKFEQ